MSATAKLVIGAVLTATFAGLSYAFPAAAPILGPLGTALALFLPSPVSKGSGALPHAQ